MKKLILSAAILGTSFLASSAFAQNYYYPSSNSNSYGYHGPHSNNYQVLGRNVNQLHQYGQYMTNNYALEQRHYRSCRNSANLLAEMRRFNTYTAQLVSSYHGSCPKTFRGNVSRVNSSFSKICSLRKYARVSPTVSAYIHRTAPINSYVSTNCSYFHPRTTVVRQVPPSHGHGHRSHSRRCDDGFDLKSAIIGAVAGRIIHEIAK